MYTLTRDSQGVRKQICTSKGDVSGQGQLLYLLTQVDVEVADELRLLSRYSDTWERQSALIICEEGNRKIGQGVV